VMMSTAGLSPAPWIKPANQARLRLPDLGEWRTIITCALTYRFDTITHIKLKGVGNNCALGDSLDALKVSQLVTCNW
jgi:hypothetical protein